MMVPWIDQMEYATDRGSRKAEETTAHENDDFETFHEILKLVTVFDEKFTKFSRWREFHCLAAPRLVFQVIRRAVSLWSNTEPRVNWRTIGRHGVGSFRSFKLEFLETCTVASRTRIFCEFIWL